MKELPKVYVKPIERSLQNNKDLFYSKLQDKKDSRDVLREIDHIFHSRDFVYKKRVLLTLNDEIVETTIVGKNNTSLLTLDGKSIPITKIKDIKKID